MLLPRSTVLGFYAVNICGVNTGIRLRFYPAAKDLVTVGWGISQAAPKKTYSHPCMTRPAQQATNTCTIRLLPESVLTSEKDTDRPCALRNRNLSFPLIPEGADAFHPA